MTERLNKIFLYLFLISIFFFKIPNFYIIPFFKSAFVTTQALARILLFLVFCFQLTGHFLRKEQIFFDKNSKITIKFILIFFILQTLSIFVIINPLAFLSRYKDVLISLIGFFTFFFYRKYLREITVVLLLSVIANFLYQSLIVFYQDFFVVYLSPFIYQKHIDLVIAKLQEGKIYTDTYDEIVLPLLFIFPFIEKKSIKSLSFYGFFMIISAFSFLSNIRTRLLMLFISFIGTILVFKKIAFKKIFIVTLSVLVMGFLINNVMRYFVGYSFVDRLIFENEISDVAPVNYRLVQIKNALEMGKSSLFGVGLGNYYDNLGSADKNNSILVNKTQLPARQGAQEFVHNIFGAILAESGYMSLFVFLLILFLFIRRDIYLIKKGKNYEKAFIIAFWSLFSYGLFNPILPASYQVLFWGIRGILIL